VEAKKKDRIKRRQCDQTNRTVLVSGRNSGSCKEGKIALEKTKKRSDRGLWKTLRKDKRRADLVRRGGAVIWYPGARKEGGNPFLWFVRNLSDVQEGVREGPEKKKMGVCNPMVSALDMRPKKRPPSTIKISPRGGSR